MEKILIIGIGCVTVKYAPAAMRRAGYDAVFLGDVKQFSGESKASVETCASYQADIEDMNRLMCLLAERPEILDAVVAVTSLWDEKFPMVEQVARTHDIGCPDKAITLLSQKAEVGRRSEALSARVDHQWRLNLRCQPSCGRRTPSELILKPSLSAGALGQVCFAPGEVSVDAIRSAIEASELPEAGTQEWILQERIDGNLFSLEGFVQHGAVTFIGFSQRMRVGLTETGNMFPADGIDSACRSTTFSRQRD